MAIPAVAATDPTHCTFAIVQQVAITNCANGQVSFQTRTQKNLLGDFTVSADQILASPPTGSPTPVTWTPGAVGNLYLNRTAWDAAEASPKGGLFAYNVTGAVLFKYPQCAPFRGIEPLDIVPSSIQVTGDDGTIYDLLGDNAATAQQVAWNAATRIRISLKNGEVKQVWPTKITVTGTPKAFPNIKSAGTVDILDCEHADFVQTLAWQNPKDPITLRLNERGFETFKIVQSAIHQFAAGANVTYPGALVDDLKDRGVALDPDHAKALDAARVRLEGMGLTSAQRATGKRPN